MNMQFNQDKNECLKIGRNEDFKSDYNYLSPDLKEIILDQESVRDLGVIMSAKAGFSEHISMVIKKVKRKCGWIH